MDDGFHSLRVQILDCSWLDTMWSVNASSSNMWFGIIKRTRLTAENYGLQSGGKGAQQEEEISDRVNYLIWYFTAVGFQGNKTYSE